jgi:hypothetical protein
MESCNVGWHCVQPLCLSLVKYMMVVIVQGAVFSIIFLKYLPAVSWLIQIVDNG